MATMTDIRKILLPLPKGGLPLYWPHALWPHNGRPTNLRTFAFHVQNMFSGLQRLARREVINNVCSFARAAATSSFRAFCPVNIILLSHVCPLPFCSAQICLGAHEIKASS